MNSIFTSNANENFSVSEFAFWLLGEVAFSSIGSQRIGNFNTRRQRMHHQLLQLLPLEAATTLVFCLCIWTASSFLLFATKRWHHVDLLSSFHLTQHYKDSLNQWKGQHFTNAPCTQLEEMIVPHSQLQLICPWMPNIRETYCCNWNIYAGLLQLEAAGTNKIGSPFPFRW